MLLNAVLPTLVFFGLICGTALFGVPAFLAVMAILAMLTVLLSLASG